ncbi:MAG: ABC transporter substrate-binding protein [Clostridiaceae bacterium]|nr:ABC transporter substrate-binding protein [Clostridiaceae bacterium]
MRLSKITALILACFMTLSLLSACGSKNDTPGGASSTPVNSKTPNDEKAIGGLHNLEDGVLDVGTSINWETLTPFRSNIGNNAPFASLLYETLAKLTHEKDYIPVVAKSWSAEADGVTFNIEIYDYVTDSAGNKITASDIVWMIQASKEAGLKPVFAKVDSVEQTGDYTLKVKMKQDIFGAFEQVLTNTFVVSKAAYEASKDEFNTEVVSTSQYLLTDFVSGSVISFEKRDDYWQKDNLIHRANAANVDKISFRIITEASQAGIALETGEIDAYMILDPNTANQFKDNDKFTMKSTSYINGYQMFFSGHESRAVAEDKYLRQAIAYAVDAEGLITGVFAGYGKTMHDPIADTSFGYLDKWKSEDYYTYNVEKAKELLAKSNYKGEELELLATTNTTMQRVSQMIQAYCLQVGINVKLNLVDQALYTASRLDGSQYDIVLNHVGGDSLPDHWSIRYDANAYKTGDATSRRDEVLAEMLYKTWTREGFTEENIDAVHQYLKENMYAYGMVQPENIDIWRTDLGMIEQVHTNKGSVDFAASVYKK